MSTTARAARSSILPACRISVSLLLSETVAFMLPPLVAIALVQSGRNAVEGGTAAAIPAVGVLFGIPLVPVLVRTLGQRNAFRLGALLLAAALGIYALAHVFDSLPAWWAAGLLAGAAQAIRWIVADAAVVTLADAAIRGRVMSIHETLRSAAIGIGPTIVAVSAADVGTALACALGFTVLSLLSSGAVPALASAVGVARRRIFNLQAFSMAAATLAFAGGCLESAAGASVPVYGLSFGLGAAAAGALASAAGFGNLASQVPIGFAIDRFGLARAAGAVGLFCALAAAPLPWLVAGPLAMPALFLFGGLAGAMYTLAIVDGASRGHDATDSVTLVAAAYALGSFAGPVAGGAAMMGSAAFGLPVFLVACSIAAAASRSFAAPTAERG